MAELFRLLRKRGPQLENPRMATTTRCSGILFMVSMPQKFLSIKNYETYQHYKHRNPPWIKLHLSILDDPDFLALPDASKWHYIGLLLIASRHGNGIKPDMNYIKGRLGLTEKLDLSKRFLNDHVLAPNASKVLLTNSELGGSEKSRDRDRDRVETDAFELFWRSYPKKVGKKAALQAWDKAKDKPQVADILQAIDNAKCSEQWKKENGQFIPHPATWLNQGRWADVMALKKQSLMEEFLARGNNHDGSRTVLQGLADAHYSAVGEALPRPKRDE